MGVRDGAGEVAVGGFFVFVGPGVRVADGISVGVTGVLVDVGRGVLDGPLVFVGSGDGSVA